MLVPTTAWGDTVGVKLLYSNTRPRPSAFIGYVPLSSPYAAELTVCKKAPFRQMDMDNAEEDFCSRPRFRSGYTHLSLQCEGRTDASESREIARIIGAPAAVAGLRVALDSSRRDQIWRCVGRHAMPRMRGSNQPRLPRSGLQNLATTARRLGCAKCIRQAQTLLEE